MIAKLLRAARGAGQNLEQCSEYAFAELFGAVSGRLAPSSTELGQRLTNVGPTRADFCRNRTKLARCGTNVVKRSLEVVRGMTVFGKFGSGQADAPYSGLWADRCVKSVYRLTVLSAYRRVEVVERRTRCTSWPHSVGIGVRHAGIAPKNASASVVRACSDPWAAFGDNLSSIVSLRPPRGAAASF